MIALGFLPYLIYLGMAAVISYVLSRVVRAGVRDGIRFAAESTTGEPKHGDE